MLLLEGMLTRWLVTAVLLLLLGAVVLMMLLPTAAVLMLLLLMAEVGVPILKTDWGGEGVGACWYGVRRESDSAGAP